MSDQDQSQAGNIPPDVAQKYDEELVNPPPEKNVEKIHAAELLRDTGVAMFARESLLIGGWVAMWRPLEICLYDWWPLLRRRRVYKSISRAQILVAGPA